MGEGKLDLHLLEIRQTQSRARLREGPPQSVLRSTARLAREASLYEPPPVAARAHARVSLCALSRVSAGVESGRPMHTERVIEVEAA